MQRNIHSPKSTYTHTQTQNLYVQMCVHTRTHCASFMLKRAQNEHDDGDDEKGHEDKVDGQPEIQLYRSQLPLKPSRASLSSPSSSSMLFLLFPTLRH